MARLAVFIFLFGVCIASCNGAGGEEAEKKGSACKMDSVNPNGNSELAILMRKMAAGLDSAKQDILNHREVRPLPDNIATILTAKKTDPNLDLTVFDPLAQKYLASVKDYYSSTAETKNHNYNSVVKACVTCHESFCGGPIKRIKKLLLPE